MACKISTEEKNGDRLQVIGVIVHDTNLVVSSYAPRDPISNTAAQWTQACKGTTPVMCV
jgi:hypothetical protein